MSWASRRRFIILSLLSALGVAFIALLFITVFYKAPSCSDGIQNQGEAGIDCGGSCQYLCTDQEHVPTVLFTKALKNSAGHVDIIASVENVNAGVAAKNVPYKVTLYGAGQVFVQEMKGTIDLPPATTVSVFLPKVVIGNQKTIRAFLTIDAEAIQWFTMTEDARIKPVVSNTTIGGTDTMPRIDATLTNANATTLTDVKAIILVRDAQGEVIAASRTIVPTIPAQGQATATFTWNTAFPSIPAAIEVQPIIPLPDWQGRLQ